jgi:hypothetical protein
MQTTAQLVRTGWPATTGLRSPVFAPLRKPLGLLNDIARIAAHLLLIRVISVVGLIVALWLCPVQVFAHLGLYLAALGLASLAVFGRYELLIVGARNDRQCADAMHLCILLGSCAVLTTLAVALYLRHQIPVYIALAFAGALLARAALRVGQTLATRHGRYDRAVKALVPHAVAQPFTLVFMITKGYDPFFAFVLSDLIGHSIAAACVCLGEARAIIACARQPVRVRHIGRLATDNAGLPTVNLSATASAFLFATAPLFFLPGLSNAVLAGMLALLFRVLDLPTHLTSSSLAPILMKEVADRNRNGIERVSRSTFLLPAVIAITVFALISLGGYVFNRLGLVPGWYMALVLLPVVALFQASIAATAPLIDIATLAGRQKGLSILNIVSVGFAVAALLIWRQDPVFAILIAGAIGFLRVVIMSYWLVGPGNAAARLVTES